jgi:predicted membrane-bound spermidine synthase
MAFLFLSGMAGLVYEVVWARYLALFLGHTSYAVVAVLVAFMGGLALGNLWFGAWADRARHPLAFYGWLELAIGVCALLFSQYYSWCEAGYLGLARKLQPGSSILLALKFGFSLLAILPPTVLMGGTLPVLTRLLTRSLGELREKVAALYFVNSAGAVAGCWVADFWWLPGVGLKGTLLGAAALNFAVGLGALLADRALRKAAQAVPEPARRQPLRQDRPGDSPPAEESFSPEELRLAVIAIGCSGFVAMLYEVAWSRLLALALGSTTHAFSLMLMTFIAGIAAGSYLAYRWKNLRQSLTAFGWVELVLALTVALSLALYQFLPYWFAWLSGLLSRRPESFALYELIQGAICFLVMFAPTVCLGLTMPLASRAATADARQAGRSVGRVFAVNTLGTVLGTALTGLWLMPWLGLGRTFVAGIAVNALIGAGIVARGYWLRRKLWLALAPVLVVGAVAGAGAFFGPGWQSLFIVGLWRQDALPASWREFHEGARKNRPLYYRDGASGTVSVQTLPVAGTNVLYLKVNGKVDASTGMDMPTQVLSGHLPLLLRPNAEQVLVVGLGSGVTAGAVACHPAVKHLDIVEISPEVAAAARLFAPYNRHVLADPRTRLVIEDAKSFLRTTRRQYHAIISEPSNPWMAGVSGVFSLEYFRECRGRLSPDGIMVQWINAYSFSDAALDLVLRTFVRVFPFMSLWHGRSNDLFLVGTVDAPRADVPALVARMEHPAVKADLARIGISLPAVLLARELVSPENAAFLPSPVGRAHSDFFPVLEYIAQRDFFARATASRWQQVDENLSPRATTLLAQYLNAYPQQPKDYESIARGLSAQEWQNAGLLFSLLRRWRRESPGALEPLELLTRMRPSTTPGDYDALRLAALRDQIIQRSSAQPQLLRQYAFSLMESYREERSVFYVPPTQELQAALEPLLSADPANQPVYELWLAELASDQGNDAACLEYGRRALDRDQQRGPARFALDPAAPFRVGARMADALWREGAPDQAASLCATVLRDGFAAPGALYYALPVELAWRKAVASLNRPSPASSPR